VRELVDGGSFFEIKKLFAQELITGFARIDGRAVGILANQPKYKGGVLFADVPGFMIGTKVERAGIIRAGAKMISAVSEATVPRISVVVRKAYGAGLYAMSGPGFGPDCTLALPQAMIAVMGPEAAVNAVYFNKIAEKPEAERGAFVEELRAEYRADVDLSKLASELVVDEVVPGDELREQLARRLEIYSRSFRPSQGRKHGVWPV